MRHLFNVLAVAALATGCRTAGSWEGIWLVYVPVGEPNECTFSIDENFLEAEPPEEEEIEAGDWTITEEGKFSDGAIFLQVLVQNGKAVGVTGGEVWVGTADSKGLTLAWEASEDSEYEADHQEGYTYTEKTRASIKQELTLAKGDGNAYTGVLKVNINDTTTYTETDEYDSRISTYDTLPRGFLDGDDTNRPGNDDCSSGTCELVISTKCDSKTDITATFAGDNEGMFNGIEDAERDPGVGGGGGYTY